MFSNPNVPNSLNRSIYLQAVMFGDDQLLTNWQLLPGVSGAPRTGFRHTGSSHLPLCYFSRASLTSPQNFRSRYRCGLRVPCQAPTVVRHVDSTNSSSSSMPDDRPLTASELLCVESQISTLCLRPDITHVLDHLRSSTSIIPTRISHFIYTIKAAPRLTRRKR